ncbi:NADH/NAD(+) kinase [Kluyveromyces lactis]|uniref:KLLA0F16885p n=1 Tax=Kluyveromyces lactis (strain ATCC 8585 / CBS 2359 / DSM 70799 / NBRC 1267 / NRRL Y-1140 / WM37) TaxID=284590 RepID=Q6CJQ1_KLULA|nr:uncharacterized protein KLLA0_F16885g [Kluyveromyces lactis]CAG98546.1 KLLA0F16885p [Kluyveromyces lactis]|eukprot:XP_455838.1 uncharacterized protein KLLA0_F16885g [Kluyveromyces lactis]
MVEGHPLEKVLSASALTSSSNSSSRSSIPLTFEVTHQHKTQIKRFQNVLTSDSATQDDGNDDPSRNQGNEVSEQFHLLQYPEQHQHQHQNKHQHQHQQQHEKGDLDEVLCTQRMFRKLSTGSDDVKKVYSHAQLSSTAHGVRLLSKNLSNTKVALEVKKLMIVTKRQDDSLIYLTRELVEWILVNYPTIDVYVEYGFERNESFNAKELCKDSKCGSHKIQYWSPEFVKEHEDFFDLIITLGGDGTVLYVSSIFQKNVPPVMSFALGSLGFLTNFQFEDFKHALSKILQNKIKTKMRMRLCCQLFRKRIKKVDEEARKTHIKYTMEGEYHVLNELTIDRGPSPFISMLELYGDGSLLTVAQADGLIIASPTGSTAYSLSAGGSLVYPSVNAIAVTPICPHTLSFRPIILPDSMTLKVKVPKASRSTAWAAFDGKNRVEMKRGDYIVINASPYSFPTLEARSTEFIDSISRTLNWNVRESQKSFTHMLSRKNQQKYEIHTVRTRQDSEEEEELEDDQSDDYSTDSDSELNE